MTAQTPRRYQAAIAFIIVTAVLDIVALGIIIPVLPPLIEEFSGSNASAGWINGETRLSWSEALPPANRLVEGHWFGAAAATPEASVDRLWVDMFHLKLGDTLTVGVGEQRIEADLLEILGSGLPRPERPDLLAVDRIEEVDGRIKRRTDRYFLRFDQRPGANQFLSFYLGNVSYEHSLPDGENRSNWSSFFSRPSGWMR